jgi:hypothetical protein
MPAILRLAVLQYPIDHLGMDHGKTPLPLHGKFLNLTGILAAQWLLFPFSPFVQLCLFLFRGFVNQQSGTD